MPGKLDKKLKTLRNKHNRIDNIPKSFEAEAEQQATLKELKVEQLPGIDKVQMFMGEKCLEFTKV